MEALMCRNLLSLANLHKRLSVAAKVMKINSSSS